MRNALAYVPKGQQSMVSASLRQAFLQEDADKAHQVWRAAADAMRQRWPKLGVFMDNSEHDVLAYMGGAAQGSARAAGGMAAEGSPSSTEPSCTAQTRWNA